jgi:DNA-binding beta-propeller fold protein YncE
MTAQPHAKVSGEGGFHITWTGKYPDEGAEGRGFGQKLAELLLGKRPPKINTPAGIMMDHQDHLWILNRGNGFVTYISDNKTRQAGRADHSPFPSLVSVCRAGDHGLFFTDSYLNKVFMIMDDTRFEPEEFPAEQELIQPTGIAFCAQTEILWIVETSLHRISLFTLDGKRIQTIGGRGSGPGAFNFPTHIWIDEEGTAYVVDAMNFRVQVFDSAGNFMNQFGKPGRASGCMARPKGIATDSYGHIYLVDALFNNVQVFSREGTLLTWFGGPGKGEGEFRMPSGIFIDEKDRIYVSDSYNNRIQVFRLGKSN